MMDKLYHKIILPSGRVRYIESQEWDTGKPADGLWVVRRSGQAKTWLSKQIALHPDGLIMASWIASHVDEIATVIYESRNDHLADNSAFEIARKIVVKLMEEA